jgi:chemotaxis methyl-accepting protein methylase
LSTQKIGERLPPLFNSVKSKTGLNISNFKPAFLERRIQYRMRILDMDNYADYLNHLTNSIDEAKTLYLALSINVTKFFRDPSVWVFLDNIAIPELTKASNLHSISAWSCACASGEEPHSVSILLEEYYKQKQINYTILATDISQKAIDHSKKGIYVDANLINVSSERMVQNFIQTIDGKYHVKLPLRNKIRYQKIDMMKNMLHKFDIVFCRNVLIYYDKETHEEIFKMFHSRINKNGLLVLGQDESMIGTNGNKFFELLDPKNRVYKKI